MKVQNRGQGQGRARCQWRRAKADPFSPLGGNKCLSPGTVCISHGLKEGTDHEISVARSQIHSFDHSAAEKPERETLEAADIIHKNAYSKTPALRGFLPFTRHYKLLMFYTD